MYNLLVWGGAREEKGIIMGTMRGNHATNTRRSCVRRAQARVDGAAMKGIPPRLNLHQTKESHMQRLVRLTEQPSDGPAGAAGESGNTRSA